ncbi:MAG: autoinducer 2 ABC transporter substrate-binding protein [Chthonomonadales bacterium]|nr:autoinducer 2 ABC transporter substrate-binding protein [Chthonomonadales bacterium]
MIHYFRLIALSIAVMTMTLLIASCAQEQPGDKTRRIAFVFKVDGLLYSEVCKQGAEQAAKDLGIRVDYLAPDKAEVGKQIAIIEQLIAEKADAIIVSPNDADAIVPVIAKAMDAGIKVFTWDSDAPKSQRIFYVAAADDVQIGVDIADALAKQINGKGKVQIVSGGRGAANLNLHVTGMEKAFAKYRGITLVKPYIYNDDDNQKARSMAVAALQKDPDIVGFACANSPSAPAVGEAITSLKKIGKIGVWGLALPSETRSYLKSGAVSGLMLWDPAKLTAFTARAVNDYLDGKQPTDGAEVEGVGKITYKNGVLLIPGATITKNNVDQFDF